ncbi:hypothetical protein EDD86DRAFT_207826 [Gorgonomyces haynaldii]|nr:hypothetical protein EDD86DRAFT_207826 [Gorgonomyces haynaldii]
MMEKLIVFKDGTAMGTCSNDSYYLSKTGAVLIHKTPTETLKYLVECCPQALVPMCKELLYFRNQHHTPFMTKPMVGDLETKRFKVPIQYCRWKTKTDKTKCESIDGMMELQLSDNQSRFKIRFPCRVWDSDSDDFEYLWVVQDHSLLEIPEFCRPPVDLLHGSRSDATYVVSLLPTFDRDQISPFHLDNEIEPFDINSKPFCRYWTPLAFYQTIHLKQDILVECVIHWDETLFRTDTLCKFISMITENSEEMYSIDAHLPVAQKEGVVYPLSEIVSVCVFCFQHDFAYYTRLQKISTSETRIVKPVIDCKVPDIGVFTGFDDGSVQGAFCDGTFITLKHLFSIQTVDGDLFDMRRENIISHKWYCNHLLKFEAWYSKNA